jgi:hypothetical protein
LVFTGPVFPVKFENEELVCVLQDVLDARITIFFVTLKVPRAKVLYREKFQTLTEVK